MQPFDARNHRFVWVGICFANSGNLIFEFVFRPDGTPATERNNRSFIVDLQIRFWPFESLTQFHVEANVCTAILPRTLSAGHTVAFTSWCIVLQDGYFEIEILFSIVCGNCTRCHVHRDAVPGRSLIVDRSPLDLDH
jgi:hypothetical protein